MKDDQEHAVQVKWQNCLRKNQSSLQDNANESRTKRSKDWAQGFHNNLVISNLQFGEIVDDRLNWKQEWQHTTPSIIVWCNVFT